MQIAPTKPNLPNYIPGNFGLETILRVQANNAVSFLTDLSHKIGKERDYQIAGLASQLGSLNRGLQEIINNDQINVQGVLQLYDARYILDQLSRIYLQENLTDFQANLLKQSIELICFIYPEVLPEETRWLVKKSLDSDIDQDKISQLASLLIPVAENICAQADTAFVISRTRESAVVLRNISSSNFADKMLIQAFAFPGQRLDILYRASTFLADSNIDPALVKLVRSNLAETDSLDCIDILINYLDLAPVLLQTIEALQGTCSLEQLISMRSSLWQYKSRIGGTINLLSAQDTSKTYPGKANLINLLSVYEFVDSLIRSEISLIEDKDVELRINWSIFFSERLPSVLDSIPFNHPQKPDLQLLFDRYNLHLAKTQVNYELDSALKTGITTISVIECLKNPCNFDLVIDYIANTLDRLKGTISNDNLVLFLGSTNHIENNLTGSESSTKIVAAYIRTLLLFIDQANDLALSGHDEENVYLGITTFVKQLRKKANSNPDLLARYAKIAEGIYTGEFPLLGSNIPKGFHAILEEDSSTGSLNAQRVRIDLGWIDAKNSSRNEG